MTESKYEGLHEALEDELEWEDLTPILNQGGSLTKNETSRWAYYLHGQALKLTINGQKVAFKQSKSSQALAALLANQRHTEISSIETLLETPESQELLLNLINGNHLYFDEA